MGKKQANRKIPTKQTQASTLLPGRYNVRARRAFFVSLLIVAIAGGLVWWQSKTQAATHVKGESGTASVEARLLNDPNVLWVGTGESSNWRDLFGTEGQTQPRNATQATPPTPWHGKAIKVGSPGKDHPDSGDGRWGYSGRNTFASMGIPPQEEAYFRYYVWIPHNLYRIGKMPGLQGQMGNIWGPNNDNVGVTGQDDWGTRTMWKPPNFESNPNNPNIGMITYLNVLHAAGAGKPEGYSVAKRYQHNGTEILFNKGSWNLVEQRVKLNTPGQKNGIFEGWINGVKGVSLNDVEYRTHSELKINQFDFVIFWGGPEADYAQEPTYFYFDDFVISKAPIGPRDDSQPAERPDLVVTDVSWSPSNPRTGEPIRFSATIKNQGSAPTPADTIHGVAFSIDGKKYTWSDDSTASLAPGASRTLTANGGISGHTDGTWLSTASGTFTLEAWVDDATRITESDEGNNKLVKTLTVTTAITPGDVNGDGVVNAQDLHVVLSNYGKASQSSNQGDVDGDGTVTGLDLSVVLSRYTR